MKTLITLCLIAVSSASFSQIFYEDFNNTVGLPAGWTVIDNDGLTPDAAVAQFTSAWIIAPDFDNTGDSVAMSTSWYAPAGTSDDWLITPQITLTTNNTISWDEEAQDANFPDGYELRISTTTPTIPAFMANAALYTVASASPALWSYQTVDLQLAGYSNQSVYFAWRNTSTDQFILMIDSVIVQASAGPVTDVSMAGLTSEYTQVPLSQISPLGTSGVIDNIGGTAVTNATMTVNVYDGLMANVYTASSTPVGIAMGANTTATVAGFTPVVADVYTVEYIASITEIDADALNDTTMFSILVTDSTYARDNGVIAGALGIGAGNGGQLGQQFTMNTAGDITSVSFWVSNSGGTMTGEPLVVSIYDMSVGVPNAMIAQTDTVYLNVDTNIMMTASIAGGPFSLPTGNFVVLMEEVDSTALVGYTNQIFTTGSTWLNWPTIPGGVWDNNEAFGFNVSYVLRPNFGGVCVGVLDLTVTETGGVLTSGATTPATYQWYDCTAGSNLSGETGQTYTPSVTGSYSVIVTNGVCSDTSACTAVTVGGITDIAAQGGIEVYPNPSNGTFNVKVNGVTTNELSIEVLDMTGRVIETRTFDNVQGQLTTSIALDVQEGTYLLRISANGESATQSIVISKK